MTRFRLSPTRAVVATIFTLASGIALAGDLKLPELMQLLAQQKSGNAAFVERKYIGLVDRPIESSGELAFTAPSKLEKRTVKPVFELLVLVGDSLTIERADGRRMTVSLRENPEISAFVESIRGTLAGDQAALEKFYSVELAGSLEKWQLVLTPTNARMAKVISRIMMAGARRSVKTIEFQQADGDRSEMTISEIPAR